MNLASVSVGAQELITPFLPCLVGLGTEILKETAKAAGTASFKYAKALWEKLSPSMDDRPGFREAVHDLAKAPEDTDAQAALRLQLRKILVDDPELAEEITRILGSCRAVCSTVSAAGDRSVAIGGNVTSSQIVTGDSEVTKSR